jgi:hypothetical protein
MTIEVFGGKRRLKLGLKAIISIKPSALNHGIIQA